jgi:hypothetical protein
VLTDTPPSIIPTLYVVLGERGTGSSVSAQMIRANSWIALGVPKFPQL